jgi:hypothetical protein
MTEKLLLVAMFAVLVAAVFTVHAIWQFRVSGVLPF